MQTMPRGYDRATGFERVGFREVRNCRGWEREWIE